MSRRSPRIKPFAVRTLKKFDGTAYDGALASLGFETRCRQIPTAIGTPRNATVIPFGDRHEHDYNKNEKWFNKHKWQNVEVNDEEFASWTAAWLAHLAAGRKEPARIAVDVSSMSRLRIGAVVEAILTLPTNARAEVDLLYTPAEFEKPEVGHDPQVFEVAPVSDYFAGWWSDLAAPLFAVIGVGYELEMAASAIDKLEPERTIVFSPDGQDPRYRDEIEHANHALMETKGVQAKPTAYEVADPFGCFIALESAVAKLEQQYRVAFVALGPKIYAACAMLASGLHPETSQVIRVTTGTRGKALNRLSNGKLCGLTVMVTPPRDTVEPDKQ